jgi:tetratricopeptide (TPR) repeat protein
MNAEKNAYDLSEASSHLEQAYAAEARGDPQNALDECDLSLQLYSGNAEAHNLRGIVLEQLGRKEEALAAYQKAVRLDSTLADAQENLVELTNELRGGEVAEIQTPTRAEEPIYLSIGGPLILTALGMIVTPLLLLYQLFSNLIPSLSGEGWRALTTPGTGFYHPLWAPVLIIEVLGNVAFLVFSIILAVFFFQKRRVYPKLFIAFLLSNLAFALIDYLVVNAVANSVPRLAGQFASGFGEAFARSVIYSAIWIPYFLTSKRVKGTFVR